jgi:hypothetical protein
MKISRGVRSRDKGEIGRRGGLLVLTAIVGSFLGHAAKGQTTSSPTASVHQRKAHNFGAEIVEDEAKALKAPTGFGAVKWLLNVDEVKALRPKAAQTDNDHLWEEMEWLGRKASVSYGFQDGLFIIAIVTLMPATPEDYAKTQKYLDTEYGDMPKPAKTEKFVLSSIYKKGRFCIMHDLWPSNSARPTNSEQVTIFRTKL